MIKLWSIILAVLALTWFSCLRTDSLRESKGKQDRLFFSLAVLVLVFFAGLRTAYNDTSNYLYGYISDSATPPLEILIRQPLKLGDCPGFFYTCSFMKLLRFDEHLFIFSFAAFDVCVYLWFIRKHSPDLLLSVFLFIVKCYFFFFAGMKQATASAIALFAVEAALNRHWVRYAVALLIAATFHPFVLLYATVPLLLGRKPWSKTTYIMIGLVLLLGYFFAFATGVFSYLAQLIGDTYSAEDLASGTGVNIFRFLVSFANVAVCFIFRHSLYDDSEPADDLFFHLSMIGTAFMFLSLFGNQILIGRIPAYFSAFSCLNLSYAVYRMSKEPRAVWLKPSVILGFTLFFTYEELINADFWGRYRSINLVEFLYSVRKII